MPTNIGHFINGAHTNGATSRTVPSYNPATGEQSGVVALAGAAEADAAVAAAKRAFPSWANTPPLRRARVLNRFLRICEERIDKLAAIITAEHGKVISDARGEIQRGLEVVEFATGIPQMLKGEVTENVGTRVDSHALRQPLGVVAGITPFNFPVARLMGADGRTSEWRSASLRAYQRRGTAIRVLPNVPVSVRSRWP
jgi:malonate-semialdehyde dehydrogenase (acetylating) / methylmalonate-semialdehyde dehydrogenase